MRKRLLILALLLTLLYLVGGSEVLADAISKLFVLVGMQVVTYFLEERPDRPTRLRKAEPRQLKKKIE